MLKKIYTAFFLLFLCSFVYAQSDILPGTIVTLNGDTLKGFIHDKRWSVNPSSLMFQTSLAAPVQEFSPEQIRSFRTARGVLYESHTIKYDDSRDQLTYLTQSRDPEHYANARVFLQVIVQGNPSLGFYTDANGREHYFLKEPDKSPVELLNRSYLVNSNGLQVARTYQPWRQQIAVLCPSIADEVRVADYTRSSLKKLFENLNKCLGSTITPILAERPETQKKKTEFGVVLQLFTARMRYADNYFYASTNFSKLNWGVGASVETNLRNSRLSLYNELKLKRFEQKTDGTTSYANLSSKSIRLVTALRTSFGPNGNFYGDVGVTNGYRISEIEFVGTFVTPSKEDTRENSIESGIVAGLGWKRYFASQALSFRVTYEYEIPVGIRTFSSTTSLGLVAGFVF